MHFPLSLKGEGTVLFLPQREGEKGYCTTLFTLVIALIVGATSTALAQASDVVDRSDELVALDRMGVEPGVDAAARRHQVLMPLLATLLVSLGLGVLVGLPALTTKPDLFTWGGSSGVILLATVVATAQAVADEYCNGEFRLVFNTGPSAGQTVFHVHAHVLGGTLSEGSLGQ